jgi:hypothetical protein
MRRRLVLIVMLVPMLTAPASAGILFGKKNKPNPADRVPELIGIVRTDGDEHKRSAAAEELRQYDPTAFPEIVPALIEVLLNDKKPGVRAEAAQSLGKLRPVSQQAGMALEQALAKDSSMRVRLQARSALVQYHWSGYHGPKKDEPPIQTKEPPVAPPVIQTKEPPLALPPPMTKPPPPRIVPQPAPSPTPPATSSPGAKPLPAGPVQPPLVPTEPPILEPPPKGPELTPPPSE